MIDQTLTIDGAGILRDAEGRDVVLRGVNTGGRSKWAPFVPFPIPDASIGLEAFEALARTFYARLLPWGLGAVRMTFSWEALEPTRGRIDQTYLDRYRKMVDVCGELGIAVVVDFHQDVYAGCFAGDGFPLWTLPEALRGPHIKDRATWFFGYMGDSGVREAFDRLWSNADGVMDDFESMWTTMARTFKDHPAVVGFELINEPGWGSATDIDGFKREVLTPFVSRLGARVREVAPDKLVLYDAPGIDGLSPDPTHFHPDGMEGLVFAPHIYDPGLITSNPFSGMAPEGKLDALADFRDAHATPILLGEFGIGDGAAGGDAWLRRTMERIDAHRFSATLWEYSVSEERWNCEDLSVVNADGTERAVLDHYIRPYVAALAGEALDFSYDPDTTLCTLHYASSGGETLVRLPARLYKDGPQKLHTFAGQATFDPVASALRLEGAAGSNVAVEFKA